MGEVLACDSLSGNGVDFLSILPGKLMEFPGKGYGTTEEALSLIKEIERKPLPAFTICQVTRAQNIKYAKQHLWGGAF